MIQLYCSSVWIMLLSWYEYCETSVSLYKLLIPWFVTSGVVSLFHHWFLSVVDVDTTCHQWWYVCINYCQQLDVHISYQHLDVCFSYHWWDVLVICHWLDVCISYQQLDVISDGMFISVIRSGMFLSVFSDGMFISVSSSGMFLIFYFAVGHSTRNVQVRSDWN